jgi:hypothetical protein
MTTGRKRPTHESDAMKIFMSDSVAPEFLPLLLRYGDFAAAAVAFSAQRSPEFWSSLLTYTKYCMAMKEFFIRLHKENRPIKREWLIRIKRFASKYDDNVAAERSLYLYNMFAGIRVWSVYVPEYARELIVDLFDERGRRVERLRLPVVP